MMFTIESFHSPQYAKQDKSTINVMVKFVEFDKELPFHATPYDEMEYGRDLYHRCMAGEVGPVADWQPPPLADAEAFVRMQRNQLLIATDYVEFASYRATKTPEFLAVWDAYRQALRDVTNQPGYPYEVTFPTKPE